MAFQRSYEWNRNFEQKVLRVPQSSNMSLWSAPNVFPVNAEQELPTLEVAKSVGIDLAIASLFVISKYEWMNESIKHSGLCICARLLDFNRRPVDTAHLRALSLCDC